MSRTARLLEMLIKLQTRPRFTVQQMADEFGVSRRTMLRDLHALSEMGIPLASTPGPHGGYRLVTGRRVPPLSLAVDEALGMILSYEAFLQHAESPFATQSLSAVTKLRNALPPDVVGELDTLKRHVAVISRPRSYSAPLLADLLRAALERAHLRVVYDSASGISERTIFPFGLYTSHGFWYCACFDYKRGMNLSLRADRFVSAKRASGLPRPDHIPLANWIQTVEDGGGEQLHLRASVTRRGLKSFVLTSLFDRVEPNGSGGFVEGEIPRSEVGWFADQLLSAGTEIVVESPPELIEAMRERALGVAALYG